MQEGRISVSSKSGGQEEIRYLRFGHSRGPNGSSSSSSAFDPEYVNANGQTDEEILQDAIDSPPVFIFPTAIRGVDQQEVRSAYAARNLIVRSAVPSNPDGAAAIVFFWIPVVDIKPLTVDSLDHTCRSDVFSLAGLPMQLCVHRMSVRGAADAADGRGKPTALAVSLRVDDTYEQLLRRAMPDAFIDMWERKVSFEVECLPPTSADQPKAASNGPPPAMFVKEATFAHNFRATTASQLVGFRDLPQFLWQGDQWRTAVGKILTRTAPSDAARAADGDRSTEAQLQFSKSNTLDDRHFFASPAADECFRSTCVAFRVGINVKQDAKKYRKRFAVLARQARAAFGFVGIQNPGSACYANALSQVLYHNALTREAILNLKASNNAGLLQLQRLFYHLHKANTPASITGLFDALRLNIEVQQDAHEFLLQFYLRHVLRDAEHLFALKVSYETKCVNVPFSSTSPVETHQHLSVSPVGCLSLIDAISKELRSERLGDTFDTGDARYGRQPAERRMIIKSLPPLLWVHVRRFDARLAKVHLRMNVPRSFALSARHAAASLRALEAAAAADTAGGDEGAGLACEYVLQSMVLHHGTSPNSGHYTALCRATDGLADHRGTAASTGAPKALLLHDLPAAEYVTDAQGMPRRFLHFDDAAVYPVREHDALNRAAGAHWLNPASSAYVLLYVRADRAMAATHGRVPFPAATLQALHAARLIPAPAAGAAAVTADSGGHAPVRRVDDATADEESYDDPDTVKLTADAAQAATPAVHIDIVVAPPAATVASATAAVAGHVSPDGLGHQSSGGTDPGADAGAPGAAVPVARIRRRVSGPPMASGTLPTSPRATSAAQPRSPPALRTFSNVSVVSSNGTVLTPNAGHGPFGPMMRSSDSAPCTTTSSTPIARPSAATNGHMPPPLEAIGASVDAPPPAVGGAPTEPSSPRDLGVTQRGRCPSTSYSPREGGSDRDPDSGGDDDVTSLVSPSEACDRRGRRASSSSRLQEEGDDPEHVSATPDGALRSRSGGATRRTFGSLEAPSVRLCVFTLSDIGRAERAMPGTSGDLISCASAQIFNSIHTDTANRASMIGAQTVTPSELTIAKLRRHLIVNCASVQREARLRADGSLAPITPNDVGPAADRVRLWLFLPRANGTIRPSAPVSDEAVAWTPDEEASPEEAAEGLAMALCFAPPPQTGRQQQMPRRPRTLRDVAYLAEYYGGVSAEADGGGLPSVTLYAEVHHATWVPRDLLHRNILSFFPRADAPQPDQQGEPGQRHRLRDDGLTMADGGEVDTHRPPPYSPHEPLNLQKHSLLFVRLALMVHRGTKGQLPEAVTPMLIGTVLAPNSMTLGQLKAKIVDEYPLMRQHMSVEELKLLELVRPHRIDLLDEPSPLESDSAAQSSASLPSASDAATVEEVGLTSGDIVIVVARRVRTPAALPPVMPASTTGKRGAAGLVSVDAALRAVAAATRAASTVQYIALRIIDDSGLTSRMRVRTVGLYHTFALRRRPLARDTVTGVLREAGPMIIGVDLDKDSLPRICELVKKELEERVRQLIGPPAGGANAAAGGGAAGTANSLYSNPAANNNNAASAIGAALGNMFGVRLWAAARRTIAVADAEGRLCHGETVVPVAPVTEASLAIKLRRMADWMTRYSPQELPAAGQTLRTPAPLFTAASFFWPHSPAAALLQWDHPSLFDEAADRSATISEVQEVLGVNVSGSFAAKPPSSLLGMPLTTQRSGSRDASERRRSSAGGDPRFPSVFQLPDLPTAAVLPIFVELTSKDGAHSPVPDFPVQVSWLADTIGEPLHVIRIPKFPGSGSVSLLMHLCAMHMGLSTDQPSQQHAGRVAEECPCASWALSVVRGSTIDFIVQSCCLPAGGSEAVEKLAGARFGPTTTLSKLLFLDGDSTQENSLELQLHHCEPHVVMVSVSFVALATGLYAGNPFIIPLPTSLANLRQSVAELVPQGASGSGSASAADDDGHRLVFGAELRHRVRREAHRSVVPLRTEDDFVTMLRLIGAAAATKAAAAAAASASRARAEQAVNGGAGARGNRASPPPSVTPPESVASNSGGGGMELARFLAYFR